MDEQTATAEIESFRERAAAYLDRSANYVEAAASLVPASRFIDVDGTPEHALIALTPDEMNLIVAGAMAAVAHSMRKAEGA
jgi:hypothetical protein